MIRPTHYIHTLPASKVPEDLPEITSTSTRSDSRLEYVKNTKDTTAFKQLHTTIAGKILPYHIQRKLNQQGLPAIPKVSQILEDYDITAQIERPAERMLLWVADLQSKLVQAQNVDGLIKNKASIRATIFQLEGLFRLYEGQFGHIARDTLKTLKKIEDTFGEVDYAITMLATGKQHQVPDTTINYLEKRVKKATKKLTKLVENQWLPVGPENIPQIKHLIKTILTLPWETYSDDKQFLLQAIADTLEKTSNKDLDMNQLEDGIHELRRQIRWFPIYLTALDGFVRLDSDLNPIPSLKKLLTDPVADSKYAKLPISNREVKPTPISQSLFIANTKYIAELGDIKDIGQEIEGIAHALEKSEVAHSHQEAVDMSLTLLGKSPQDIEHIHQAGHRIYHEIKEYQILDLFKQEILAGITEI